MSASLWATSYGLPSTNVGAVKYADVIVSGRLLSTRTELNEFTITNGNGETQTVTQMMTIAEFSVEDNLIDHSDNTGNTAPSVGSVIEVQYHGDRTVPTSEGGSSTLEMPSKGQLSVIALQKNAENQHDLAPYTQKNQSAISVDGDIASIREWVNTVRTADNDTLNAMVMDEWDEQGFDYNSVLGIQENHEDHTDTYKNSPSDSQANVIDINSVPRNTEYASDAPMDTSTNSVMAEQVDSIHKPSPKLTKVPSNSPSSATIKTVETTHKIAETADNKQSTSLFYTIIALLAFSLIAIFLIIRKKPTPRNHLA